MNAVVHIPFHGSEILAVEEDGKPYIILKPAIEHIGLDYSWQLQKLKAKSWATVGETPTVGADGKVRDMASVDVRTFLMLLATIDERRVSEDARQVLIAYQREVADLIEAHFTRSRVAPVAELPPAAPFEPKTFPLTDVVVLIRQRFGVRISVADLTEKLRQGGVLRQDGKPKVKYEALFWHTSETSKTYEVFGHAIEAVYRLYESTKLRLELAAQRQLPMDPPGWPALPFEDVES